ncbi:RNA polymerase sigma-54 factor [Enhygromyxa salina]|uniref:RNA polymerase sigma-54 factor n=1 Tax=Enhygromyxa salina TaxID=215803 RepID=A0A2S9YDR9_9BACT|nr:RNA polymerase factor sigma-54 [Enhygromyxa salina]PRQ03259.1 RNA polymerase sigma-54 factor [Enhygromyxa salina]
MVLHMRQELRMSQQLVMTPQLQQAIKLLQLSRIELQDLVRNELLENPLLEESQEMGTTNEEPVSAVEMQDGVERQGDTGDGETKPAEAPSQEVKADEPNVDNFDWEAYLQHHSLSGPLPSGGVRPDDDLPGLEQTMADEETLVEHLMWQVRLSNFSSLEEEVAEYVVRSVSGAGYLNVSVPQIAARVGCSTLLVEQVLRRVQQLDPLAIASRNLAEVLWIQARHPEHPIDDPLVLTIIAKHLPNLEKRAYPAVARDTGEALEEVYEATKIIMGLEPRPARQFVSESPQYVTPDVYVHKIGEEYVVTLNDDGLPKLKISNYYKSAMLADSKAKAKGQTRSKGDGGQAKDYITERLRSAQWLIRSIQQRQRTILKVTKSILGFQREFFEKGPQHLRPLILKDVAEDIEMHESTVSRVTTNKYVHTPQGIYELKYFFNAGISKRGGGELASEAVKEKIKKLIEVEDQKKPYSDQKLVELLRDEGITIARRTVAKYREQLHLLSSSKRRKLF